MKRKAFTLVEMLVVLAVIGVLAGLLSVAIGRAREKARQTQCLNNLKQLHTAAMDYASNGGRFPYATTYKEKIYPDFEEYRYRKGWVDRSGDPGDNNTANVGPIEMFDSGAMLSISNGTLYPYVADKRIYLCPTFKIEAEKASKTMVPVRSYVMNWAFNYANLFSITKGSTTILFTELNVRTVEDGKSVTVYTPYISATFSNVPTFYFYNYQNKDGALMAANNASGVPYEGIAAYHNGKGNAVFADGHVESLYYSNTVDACSGNW